MSLHFYSNIVLNKKISTRPIFCILFLMSHWKLSVKSPVNSELIALYGCTIFLAKVGYQSSLFSSWAQNRTLGKCAKTNKTKLIEELYKKCKLNTNSRNRQYKHKSSKFKALNFTYLMCAGLTARQQYQANFEALHKLPISPFHQRQNQYQSNQPIDRAPYCQIRLRVDYARRESFDRRGNNELPLMYWICCSRHCRHKLHDQCQPNCMELKQNYIGVLN